MHKTNKKFIDKELQYRNKYIIVWVRSVLDISVILLCNILVGTA